MFARSISIRRSVIAGLFSYALCSLAAAQAAEPIRFVRFALGKMKGGQSYGIVEGDNVRKITGSIYKDWQKTEDVYPLKDVRILPPTKPTQVLALAGNYKSHLKDEEIPPQFKIPQPFFKSPSCLIPTGKPIVLPKDSQVVHYEAEMVIVIGKRCKNVPKEQALDYVLGVTPGNDVSERVWQNDKDHKDVQWWRAKGADTFGPVGPYILTGVDYGNLKLTMRVNGKVVQEEKTDHLIHDVAGMVSHISNYVTLYPGDLIFTGTPGKTDVLKAGDVAEVELEGAGILTNPVIAEK